MKLSVKSTSILLILAFGSSLAASAQNAFVTDPASLTFTVPTVGANVAPQTVALSTTGAAVSFSIGTSYLTPGCSSLNVFPSSQITPSTLTVTISSLNLPIGTYNCSITLSTVQGGGFSATVPVTIQVGTSSGSSGSLSVSPTALILSAPLGVASSSGTLTIANSSATTAASYSATTNATWLSVSPTAATVGAANSLSMLVTANATGLNAGAYTASVIIAPSSGAAAIVVPVTLTVAGGPSVRVTQNGSSISAVSFAYQSGGQIPGAQSILVASSDGSNLACTFSQSSGSSYISISPLGNYSTPQTLNISLTSATTSLSAGVYSVNLGINCPGASNPSLTIPVNLTVSSLPLLSLGTPPATFNYAPGGAVPSSQAVLLSSTSSAVPFTTTLSYGSGYGWLTVSPSSGSASLANPATLVVSVSPTGLAGGTYTATVYIYSTNAGNSPVAFAVTLVVAGGSNAITATPSALSFNYQVGQAAPAAQTVNVTAGGSSITYTVSGVPQVCSNFFTVSPTSGITPGSFTVSVNTSGLTLAQVCSGTITISGSGSAGSVTVPVTLNVSTSAQLQIYPTSLSFNGVLGGSASSSQTVLLSATDQISAVGFSVYSPVSWITVTPSSGTTPSNLVVMANPNGTGLQAGLNSTTITIFSSLSSLTLPITYNLTSNSSATATPNSLAFTQAVGGATPNPQSITLTLTNATSATYSASVISGGTTGWLTVSPVSGSVPGSFTVSANGSGVPAGTYTGSLVVTVSGASNSPLTIPVTLNVTQPATLVVTPQTLAFNSTAGGSNPPNQTIQVASSAAPINFTVGASSTNCPNFFSVTPLTGITPSPLTVSINNASLPAGACNGTITISGNGSNIQTLSVSLVVASPVPLINSIGNAASYAPGSVVPGEIVTIFGSNLGPTILVSGSFSGNRFSTAVSGTQVQFDGVSAPIIYTRSDQVSAVVPFEMAGRLQTNIQVIYNGQVSATLQQRVADTAPGIFTAASSGTGQGSIVNQDGTVNGPGAPAAKGSVVAVYITGAGQTDPIGVTGGPGGSNPLQYVRATVSATIGGVQATVPFAGAAPTYIQGLYQVNVQIPDGVSSGNLPISITIGGVATQSGVTINVQ